MRRTLLLCFFTGLCIAASAQTNLSGIINAYAAVTAIDTCTGTITVEQTTGFQPGMNVILVQMQGAEINTSNNANFGNINNLRSAGLYERARIQSINGNQIILENSLFHRYDVNGKVQVISLPSHTNATINDTLTAKPWDGKTGGVLALEVLDTLTLAAPIETSGRGFRGGIADITASNNCNFLRSEDDYFYNLNNWRGAAKGEGIAVFTKDREAGRGAQANGGGGGNDHNAGGGGGAHVGAGGRGGNNNEPDFFGCDGNFPGLGGKELPDLSNRLFLGGGGGAGHGNNLEATNGGSGGGIVLLLAKVIKGNNFKIAANGITPPVTRGDGAGGGGAGGTVLLDVETIVTPFLVEATGGSGGDIDNRNGARCHGPGGGGSGGRLVAALDLQINYLLIRGEAGVGRNSTSCPQGSNGAEPGGDGFHDPFPGIPQSQAANVEPVIVSQPRSVPVCLNQPFRIPVIANGGNLQYQWRVNKGDGAGFQNISESGIYTGTTSSELVISGLSSEMLGYQFQVVLSSNCAAPLQSEPIPLVVQPAPTPQFDFTLTGNTVQFNNTSTNADTYIWNYGDGQTSDLENPDHTFAQSGNYMVTLSAINLCDTIIFTQNIEIVSAPTAGFTANATSGCAPFSVTFENTSSANATSFAWILPGALPNFSTQQNPTVSYNASGKYPVTLIASNINGIDTLRMDSFIVVNQTPIAAFAYNLNDLDIIFNNNSTNSNSYAWNFGDDQTSSDLNPTHTYSKPGSYTITLVVTNACGSDTTTQTLTVGAPPQALFSVNRSNGCAPHVVDFSDVSSGTFATRSWEFPGGNPATSTEANPRVIYSNPGEYGVRLVVSGVLGSDTLQNLAFINVLPAPTSTFSYSVSGNTVTFNNTSTNAQSYLWNFGNGQTSAQQNPVHTFPTGGVYTVTLNASNAYCGRSSSQTVAVGLTGVEDLRESGIILFPNPTHNQLFINAITMNKTLQYYLYDLQGQLLQNGTFSGKTELNLANFANGMYLLELQREDKIWVAKIIKQ